MLVYSQINAVAVPVLLIGIAYPILTFSSDIGRNNDNLLESHTATKGGEYVLLAVVTASYFCII